MKKPVVINISNLSKSYLLGQKNADSIRSFFSKKLNTQKEESFFALKNINIEIEKGDIVGIIGKNGAGKSTLLKILSQITKPTTGSIEINGRIASLLEVGTGFHPELTGRENIFLNGTILGMSRKEIKSKFEEIVEFSGVEKFIDTPVKNYSSGMFVRLAFSVAAHLEPEILIVDEVLAVGDEEFQKKCLGKMDEVSKNGRTILFVSHNIAALNKICDKGIVLKEGEVDFKGSIKDAINHYANYLTKDFVEVLDLTNLPRSRGLNEVSFSELKFNSSTYFPESKFAISIKTVINKNSDYNFANFGFHIVDRFENQVYHLSNLFIQQENIPYSAQKEFVFEIEKLKLKPGSYSIWLWLEIDGIEQDFIDSGIVFEVLVGNIYNYANSAIISGVVQPEFKFKHLLNE